MLELNKRILMMHKITKLTLYNFLLIIVTGCVQKQQTHTTSNPNDLPIATTYPVSGNEPVYPNYPSTQPVYPNYPSTQPVITQPEYVPQRTPYLRGAYASNYQLSKFIDNMAAKYNYDKYELNAIFSTVSRDTESLRKYNVYKTAKPTYSKATQIGSWDKYRANFLTPARINKGVKFWQENANYLNMAAYKYGVAPEYIVGIIGVETNFGGYTGKHSVLNALTTLSLEYKKRQKFFTSELENYLLVLRDEKLHPQSIKGSYAGAFGLAQFMPSSFREYAVDLDGDGHINLFNTADAIGSIANYFIQKGKWQPRLPVTMRTYYNQKRFHGLATGHKTLYTQKHLYSLGMRPTSNFNGY
ncbi:MAG TPA: hypothetical protein ENK95_00215, partial [Campylobacterales bacterium]|nr:hypothetical protein [Campylobacterales bacterium]